MNAFAFTENLLKVYKEEFKQVHPFLFIYKNNE